jgi:hypothetical protein
MKRKKNYEWGVVLVALFEAVIRGDKEACQKLLLDIEQNTGVSIETLKDIISGCASKNETVGHLKYRIINDMQKRGLNTSFIV